MKIEEPKVKLQYIKPDPNEDVVETVFDSELIIIINDEKTITLKQKKIKKVHNKQYGITYFKEVIYKTDLKNKQKWPKENYSN